MLAIRPKILVSIAAVYCLFLLLGVSIFAATSGFSRFTEKQLEALAQYVGNTYWVVVDGEKAPAFFSAPKAKAASFRPALKESFEITELVKQSVDTPYYKVSFESGKEGYITIDAFMEELNSAFVTYDPDSAEKKKAAQEAAEEKKREAWIRSQPWPEYVKQAVLQRQPVIGMTMSEAKVALGKPDRIMKLKGAASGEEQWIYPDGRVLTFTAGTVSYIQTTEVKTK